MDDQRQIRIFDTTLRDGQQCPGAGMNFERNLQYARLAAKVGVDVLEAGFPSASKVDFDIVYAIAEQAAGDPKAPTVAGLCQLRADQVESTIRSLEPAVAEKKARLHVYLPVDPELMRASLGDRAKDKQGLIRDLAAAVETAVAAQLEVEFSPEGYSRVAENFDFCTDLIRVAVEAGATVINCPDTIGGACSWQGSEYFVEKLKRHAAIIAAEYPTRHVVWSAHCHNDFGLALINSLNAVFGGPARQIEGCFGGVGERAGNVALEQCILAIKHFAPTVNASQPFYTRANTEGIQEICDFVARYMLPRQPHWPICGENAAKHSSGGHTNAILHNPLAYQPFDPREIGKEITFVFGPLSGGNHARDIIQKAGYRCSDDEKVEISQFIKDLYADRRKGITDEEVLRGYYEFRKPVRVDSIDYSKSSNRSSVEVRGVFFDVQGELRESHEGKDSALAALKRAIDKHFEPITIRSHKSESDKEGIDANSVSTIVISDSTGGLFQGTGTDQDIEISAMRALIDAVNHAYIERHYRV